MCKNEKSIVGRYHNSDRRVTSMIRTRPCRNLRLEVGAMVRAREGDNDDRGSGGRARGRDGRRDAAAGVPPRRRSTDYCQRWW
jgi:hypothetical protein